MAGVMHDNFLFAWTDRRQVWPNGADKLVARIRCLAILDSALPMLPHPAAPVSSNFLKSIMYKPKKLVFQYRVGSRNPSFMDLQEPSLD